MCHQILDLHEVWHLPSGAGNPWVLNTVGQWLVFFVNLVLGDCLQESAQTKHFLSICLNVDDDEH